jgi:hypothetical protein
MSVPPSASAASAWFQGAESNDWAGRILDLIDQVREEYPESAGQGKGLVRDPSDLGNSNGFLGGPGLFS